MSNLLEASKRFEKRALQEAEHTNEVLRNAIKGHEKALSTELSSAGNTIRGAIEEEKQSIINLFKEWKLYFLIGCGIIALLFVILMISWISLYRSSSYWQDQARLWEIKADASQKRAEEYQKQFEITLKTCVSQDGKKQVCGLVDPRHRGDRYGDGTYVILQTE